MKWCRNCELDPAVRKGLCLACWQYQRRNGKKRPDRLIDRHHDRKLERLVIQR